MTGSAVVAPPAERRQHEGVDLIHHHRQGKQQRRVPGIRQRLSEGLGDAEGARVQLVGQRPVEDLQDEVVLPHRQAEGNEHRRQRDDDPRPELVKIVDD
jgi:hypothetical protein